MPARPGPVPVSSSFHAVTFSRLLRPHPRVLGASVCASTRCFLAGLKFRVPVRCNYCHVFYVQGQLFFMSFFFDPVLLIALTANNALLSVVVRRAMSAAGAGHRHFFTFALLHFCTLDFVLLHFALLCFRALCFCAAAFCTFVLLCFGRSTTANPPSPAQTTQCSSHSPQLLTSPPVYSCTFVLYFESALHLPLLHFCALCALLCFGGALCFVLCTLHFALLCFCALFHASTCIFGTKLAVVSSALWHSTHVSKCLRP